MRQLWWRRLGWWKGPPLHGTMVNSQVVRITSRSCPCFQPDVASSCQLSNLVQIYNQEHKAWLKRTRSVHFCGCSTTFAPISIIMIPGFHASMINFCSSNNLPFSSSGIQILYLRAICARMQILSIRAKHCPMQLRTPPEKALTKEMLSTIN